MIPSILLCVIFNVLPHKSQSYGSPWCNEGVYRLAKELQLLDPVHFKNIFLGFGGFHTEKVMIAFCGKYLEDAGIDLILVENKVYGPKNFNHVINGGHYVRGISGMAIVSEVLYSLIFD